MSNILEETLTKGQKLIVTKAIDREINKFLEYMVQEEVHEYAERLINTKEMKEMIESQVKDRIAEILPKMMKNMDISISM